MTAPAADRSTRRRLIDAAAVAALLGVSIAGFWPTFAGGSYLVAAIGGAVLGLAIAFVAAWRQWGILTITALTIAVYFVFGGALALPHTTIAGVIPTLETLQKLALGVVTSWKQLLTTIAPVSAADGHLLVPLLLMLVTAVLAGSLAFRLQRPVWALPPLIALLVMVIALGVSTPAVPVIQGIVFAAVSVIWLALRQMWAPGNAAVSVSEIDPARASHMRRRRLLAGVAVLAIAGGAGVATSAIADPEQPRHTFRDEIIPPFNLQDYASPLQSFRKYVRDEKEVTLFTVSGLPKDGRVRIAVMDEYDGMVYNVTNSGLGSSGAFSLLRGNMAAGVDGPTATLQFEMDKYENVWLPEVGLVDEITFEGDRAEDLRRSTYYNASTGTAVATAGIRPGDSYTMDVVLQPPLSDTQLAEVEFGTVALPEQKDVPEELAAIAAETVTDASNAIEQVRALETFLAEGGFFSHGLAGEVHSRAGHTAERISALVGGQQMVGDDEQYSVAMALLAREIGIPARVVMGFYPDEDSAGGGEFAATGDTLHAWVEVNFAGVGWLPFDPTPPEDQVPNDQTTKPKADPKPQVLQPPPPPQEPVDLPPSLPDDREAEDDAPNWVGILGLILLIGGISLAVLAILALPFIVIGAWKAAKRRARRSAARTSDQISGGWDELTDRAIDYGARVSSGSTREESGTHLSESLAVPAVAVLARRADSNVFGPGDPTPADVDEFWREVDDIVAGLGKEASFWKRIKARLNMRTLLTGGAISSRFESLRAAASARTRREPGTIKNDSPATPESETP